MKIKQAFTLVELIVVITILAILSTIGFINFQSFSSNARDSKRISELTEIRSGLQIYQARNGFLPTPSEQIATIGSGSTNLIFQGYAGGSMLNEIRMNGNPKDPLDSKYYTYSVNANKTKFQLLSLLENDDNLVSLNKINLIQTANASYIDRYPYVVGNIVGVLLDETTNTPIQELTTGVDLNTDTNNYKIVFLDETLTSSGTDLYQEIITQTNDIGTTQTIYSNCEATTYDGYTIGGLSHGQIEIFTKTIDNGEKTIEASCYNGNITYGENETTSCSTNYIVDGGTCILGTCSGTIPLNAEMNGTQGSSTWSYSETSGICKYICQNGYHTEDTGNTCISSTRSCTIENGTGQETWNGTWGICTVTNCTTGYTESGNSCVEIINGTCGSSNGTATTTAPSTNLCSTGNSTSVTTNTGTFTWSCTGINTGTTASCSAPRQYTATFNANGGTTPSPTSKAVTYNTAVGTLSTTSRSGYTFNGWFTATSGGTQITTATIITTNVTYYAQWTQIINGTCGSSNGTATITAPSTNLCSTGNATSVTTNTGTFTWSCTGINTGTTASCSAPRQYTVTFNANGGTTPSPTSKAVTYNTAVGTLATTSRSGYTFNGWFTATSGGTQITTATLVTTNVTYYAQWTQIINGTCGSSNGTATTTAPSTNLCSTGNSTSVTTNTGTFTWSCTGINTGTTASCSAPRQYTVTFNANGGTTSSPATKAVTYNTAVGTLSTTSRSGYTFNGWFTATSGGTQITTGTIITTNVTYYAQWTLVSPPNAYTNSRNACETQIVTVGTYQIASCNVGATSTNPESTASYGYLFQWGNARHDTYGVSTTTSTTLINTSSCAPNNCKTSNFITYSSTPYDWSSPQNTNLWGGDEPNVATPTLESQLKKQGVCPNGFHIPTQAEWNSVINTLNVGSNGNALKDGILKLPYAGYRHSSNGSYNSSAGYNGHYWSSSIASANAYGMYFYPTSVSPSGNSGRAFGFSVRCFKN